LRNSAVEVVRLDVQGASFAEELRSLAPAVIVHCAGPFQGQDYRVALATLSVGAHYVDLADGRDFVARFASAVGPAALAADRFATSGASSVPALSSAVVDALAARFSRLVEIEVVIAPAQRAPRGAATLAGVFSYAGRPFRVWRNGAWHTAHGWQGLARRSLGEMGRRWSALCDVPDLEFFPLRYRGVQQVEFRAALEVGISHAALWLVACARRAGIPFPIERFARGMDRAASLVDALGTERGGMLVRVTGMSPDGSPLAIEWQLIADHNHGPEIPCMAAILLVGKLGAGVLVARGAHPCMGFVTLEEYAAEFARWGITTRVEESRHE
jgi:hypothetical protein